MRQQIMQIQPFSKIAFNLYIVPLLVLVKINKYNCKGPPAFKSQKCRVGLSINQSKHKLLHQFQHAKIGWFHKLILEMPQILESHEIKDHGHFWQSLPKHYWSNHWLSWVYISMQKSSSFHQFILEISPFSTTKFFDQLSTFMNLYQHAKN